MSKFKEKILIIINNNADANISNIIDTIEQTIHKLDNKTITKKIMSCSIELIQNNAIHNKNNPSEIIIIETENTIDLKVSQSLLDDDAQKILRIIKSINKKNIEELKHLYRQNLIGDQEKTGNGLISCRLKSENIIEFSNANSNLYEITLKFNKV